MMRGARERARRLQHSPLTWILLAVLVVHVIGIGWGMPGSDAWEDDGIAPRDFLVGTYETYFPGHFFTYPPVHLAGLALLTAPVWGWALLHAHSLSPSDVIAAMIQVPTMTTLTLAARGVSALMSVGIVYAVAKMAEEIRGRRASLVVAGVVGANATLTYYGHTSNLDVPYLFWATFAFLALTRAIVRHEPRRLRGALVLATVAVGTKDQAYALFLLALPVGIALWIALDRAARANAKTILRELAVSAALAGGLLLLIDGGITNPRGFGRRVAFLLGPASQNHAFFAPTWAGRMGILKDLALGFERFYPWPYAPLILAGIALHVRRTWRAHSALVAGLLPLLASLSFVIAFNFTARRTEHRFALPQSVMLAFYAGLCVDQLLDLCRAGWRRVVAVGALGAFYAYGAFGCFAVDANLLLDPRYDAEGWMAAHVELGDTIEVYGVNAYLPRFPPQAHVTRVDLTPLAARNPLPGVTELETPFDAIEARRPRWIVVPEAWVWRYTAEGPAPEGRVVPPEQAQRQEDAGSRRFFRSLFEETGRYRRSHLSTWTSTVWPRLEIHASTAREIAIFERLP